ncbi:NAD-dependent epimerase/dehydratase family protein, partial [bacterium]|nr:NAD-dependent epimerase/dehydratase family protein [bacterium]
MKLLITGHRGMVGSALMREAEKRGGYTLLTASRSELDLLSQQAVIDYL